MNAIKNLDLNSFQILLYFYIEILFMPHYSINHLFHFTDKRRIIRIKKQNYSIIYSITGVSIVITKLSSFLRFIRIKKFHVKFPLNSSHFAQIQFNIHSIRRTEIPIFRNQTFEREATRRAD